MSQSSYISRRTSSRMGDYPEFGIHETQTPSHAADPSNQHAPSRMASSKGLRSPSPGRRFEMASGGGATGGNKLAQEIHEEFLVCKICLECYKSPKSLNCLHTFCENCIENHVMSESTYKKYSDYREFTCPLCRKRTQLPIGGVKKLPDNFLVSSLSEMVTRQKPSKFPFCDFCKLVSRKHREASSKCLDCVKLLCKSCVTLHKSTKVTSNHSIFDVEIEKDIECKEHEDEVVRFYCEPCETCICVLCTFNEHKDHEITQFGEAVTKYKDNIQDMLEACKSKINKFDDQLESLNKCEDVIKVAEQRIHDTAIQFISDIRNREKYLIEELKNLYGKELMDYIENKKDLSTTVDGLRSTCNLTEVILKGKDIELLLLKKDVQKKLSSLNDIDIRTLPNTINKHVNFLPGDVELGLIQDMDRPLLSKLRHKKVRSSTDSEDEIYPTFADQQTQTEGNVIVKHPLKKNKAESESESESGSDEEDSEEESEEESEDEGPEKADKFTQTIVVESSEEETSSEEEEEEIKVEMKDQATETDEIPKEEKGVNTRSRSLQSLSHRRSPPKNDGGSDTDNSLAARRRRRRERAQTTTINYNHSFDGGDSNYDIAEETPPTYPGRKPRSRFLPANSTVSVDNGDMYYEADSNGRRSSNYSNF